MDTYKEQYIVCLIIKSKKLEKKSKKLEKKSKKLEKKSRKLLTLNFV